MIKEIKDGLISREGYREYKGLLEVVFRHSDLYQAFCSLVDEGSELEAFREKKEPELHFSERGILFCCGKMKLIDSFEQVLEYAEKVKDEQDEKRKHIILVTDKWDPVKFRKYEKKFAKYYFDHDVELTFCLYTQYSISVIPFIDNRIGVCFDKKITETAGYRNTVQLFAAGDENSLFIINDGKVYSRGRYPRFSGQFPSFKQWDNVRSIFMVGEVLYGVNDKGELLQTADNYSTGSYGRGPGPLHVHQAIGDENILDFTEYRYGEYYVSKDGKVSDSIQGDRNYNLYLADRRNNDIISITADRCALYALYKDGRVGTLEDERKTNNKIDTRDLRNVVGISAAGSYLACLHSDGSISLKGDYENAKVQDCLEWKNVTGIFALSNQMIGLQEDGTILRANYTGLHVSKINEKDHTIVG